MIRARVKADSVAEVEGAVAKLFSAIEREQPEDIRYASTKLPDGVTFVIFLQLDQGAGNPLEGLPEFQQFQQDLQTYLIEPPAAEPLTVVGSYRLFD